MVTPQRLLPLQPTRKLLTGCRHRYGVVPFRFVELCGVCGDWLDGAPFDYDSAASVVRAQQAIRARRFIDIPDRTPEASVHQIRRMLGYR